MVDRDVDDNCLVLDGDAAGVLLCSFLRRFRCLYSERRYENSQGETRVVVIVVDCGSFWNKERLCDDVALSPSHLSHVNACIGSCIVLNPMKKEKKGEGRKERKEREKRESL
jgi:hypothetical protein